MSVILRRLATVLFLSTVTSGSASDAARGFTCSDVLAAGTRANGSHASWYLRPSARSQDPPTASFLAKTCTDSFGSRSRVADWETDVKSLSASEMEDFITRESVNKFSEISKHDFLLSRHGQLTYDGYRKYSTIRWPNGSPPASWLSKETHFELVLRLWSPASANVIRVLCAVEETCENIAVQAFRSVKNTFFVGPLWRQAACEEGLSYVVKPKKTFYKYPRSWVESVCSMEHAKVYTYSFVGSVFKDPGSLHRRIWVFDFAKIHFGVEDYFKVTGPLKLVDMPIGKKKNHDVFSFASNFNQTEFAKRLLPNGTYEPLGSFDHSFDGGSAVYPMAHFGKGMKKWLVPFDEDYWRVMVQSRFTLCPAGDNPFSYRFFEAMIAGSIPILESDKHTRYYSQETASIGFHYYVYNANPAQRFVYREDWVADNFAKVVQHFTFLLNHSAYA